MNTSYDTLTITINADSSQAIADIGKLSTSLNRLNKSAQNLDTARVTEVKKLLQGVAKIDFSNVSKGLQDVVKAFNAFSSKTFMKATQMGSNLGGVYKDMADEASKYVPNFTMQDQLPATFDDLKQSLGASKSKAEALIEALAKLGLNGEQVKEVFRGLRTEAKVFDASKIEQVKDLLVAYGATAEQAKNITNHLKNRIRELGYTVEEELTPLEKLAQVLSSKGFNDEQIASVLRKIKKESSEIKGEQLEQLKEVLKEFGFELEGLEEKLTPLDELKQKLTDSGFNDQQISAVLRQVKQEMSGFSTEQLEMVRNFLMQMGMSAEDADKAVKGLAGDMNKLDGGAKKGASGLAKLANQFKNIMKYRIIRKLIQELYKAISEGVKNITAFDEKTSETVNKLKSKFEFLKNSLGAVLAPLIQMIAPILETIMTIVGEVNNALAEMFAGFNGQEQFASATDEVKDFNEELKKTQSLGIDELNVMQQEDKSSGFEMKETNGVSSVFGEAISALKEIFDSIKPVLLDLVQTLKPLLSAIGGLLKSLMPIIRVIVNLINQLVGKTAGSVNNSLASVVRAISTILDVIGTVLEILEPILSVIIEVIGFVINIINEVISLIANAIGDVLRPILALLKVVFNVLSPILNTLSGILKNIINVVENVLKGIMSVGGGVLKVIADILCAIAPILEAIVNALGFKWVDKTPTWARVLIGVATGGLSEIGHFLTSGHFATGGFPEDGFFYANHNELVGQFSNGQTAVANNEQITTGIYRAVRDALKDSGGNGQDVIINLDGYELARVVTKKQKNYGADVVMGNTLSFGK